MMSVYYIIEINTIFSSYEYELEERIDYYIGLNIEIFYPYLHFCKPFLNF